MVAIHLNNQVNIHTSTKREGYTLVLGPKMNFLITLIMNKINIVN